MAGSIPFTKASACGNDFLIIEGMHAPAEMAAFTRKDPSDRQAFEKHWAKIRSAPETTIEQMSIPFDYVVSGSYSLKINVK